MTLSTCLRGMSKNSSFFCFRAVFVSYCPLFWGSIEIYKEYDSLYILERNDKKTCRFFMYGHFRELLATVLEFQGDLQGPWLSVHVWKAWQKTHRFCVLGMFLWGINHSFGILGWFTRPITLSTFFRGLTKNLSFLHFRAIFMSYCPQFWGSGVIYKVQTM
jgi:hypothetical protein